MKAVTIIGFGRFGKTLYRLLKNDFEITIFQRTPLTQNEKRLLDEKTTVASHVKEAYANDVVFFAVPISSFESIIRSHRKYFQKNQLLIDVLSVKAHPKKVFEKYTKNTGCFFLLTHPMFGPDSSKDSFANLPFIFSGGTAPTSLYSFWKAYFSEKGLRTVELTPEEHDLLAANSQGLTHFIGRLLEEMHLKKGPIDSLGTRKLLEIEEQTCNDTWQLFTDLQQYNLFTKDMRIRLGGAYNKLYNKLLPKRVNSRYIVFGIQGGKGSFNETAIKVYIKENNINQYNIHYLYTSEKVLRHLQKGTIDYGLFAIANSTGGLVDESLHVIGKYLFSIVADFSIPIHHALMKRQNVAVEKITTIMGHPQTLKQCEYNLKKKYPQLSQQIGNHDLIDTAKIAEALAEGKLPESVAVLGPKILAEIYDFSIIEDDLQDRDDNQTRFLLVKR